MPIKVKAKIIGTVLRPISLSGPLMMQTKDIYSAKCFNDIHERCVRVVRDYSSVYVDLKLKRSPKITAKKTNIGSTVKHKLAFYIKKTQKIKKFPTFFLTMRALYSLQAIGGPNNLVVKGVR